MTETAKMEVGQTITILPRTHPGINRPGGAAFITAIHYDTNGEQPIKVDVKYVLGGRESGVEMTYVRTESDVATGEKRRGTRERKKDVKMNVGELGQTGQVVKSKKKKRAALKDIDGNRVKKQMREVKKGNEDEGEESGLPAGCEMEGEWMVIKSGKIGKMSSYTPFFTAGTSIQFWFDATQGWLHAKLIKDIQYVKTRDSIKWNVKMQFDMDDEVLTWPFATDDPFTTPEGLRRWKIKVGGDAGRVMGEARAEQKDGGSSSAKKEKKKSVAKVPAKKEKVAKKQVKKNKATKKKEAFTIHADNVKDEDISDTNVSSKPKADEKTKSKQKKELPKITPVAKAQCRDGLVDLGLLDKAVKKANNSEEASASSLPTAVKKANNSSKSADLGAFDKAAKKANNSRKSADKKVPSKADKKAYNSSKSADQKMPSKADAKSNQNDKVADQSLPVKAHIKSNNNDEPMVKPDTKANTNGITTDKSKPSASSLPAKKDTKTSYASSSDIFIVKKPTKKETTVPPSSFYKSDKSAPKKPNPFHPTQMPPTNRGSFGFSSQLQSKIKMASSNSIASSLKSVPDKPCKAAKSTGVMTVMTGLNHKSTSRYQPLISITDIHKKEKDRANDFLNQIKGSEKVAEKLPASSPGGSVASSTSGDLSLQTDQDRKNAFQKGLIEVFFKPELEEMEVNTLTAKLNEFTSKEGREEFTSLEVKTYLDQLDKEGKVMMQSDLIYNMTL